MPGTTMRPTGSAPAARPGLDDHVVVELLRLHHGLDVSVVGRLAGEVDENVVVQDGDGQRFVAKISRPADPAHVMMQAAMLDHLAGTEVGALVPRLVPATTGEHVVAIGEVEPGAWLRVLAWTPGRPLHELARPATNLLRDLGRTAGRMVAGLAGFEHPAAETTHVWDLRPAPATLRAGLDGIDGGQRQMVQTVLGWFDELVAPRLAELPTGVVHHDLNDSNVLVDRDGARVTGVIDFGDALHTVVVAELAIAAGYAMRRQPDPVGAAAEVVAGFHEVRPLGDAELAVVFPLAATRLCLNAVNWTGRLADRDDGYATMRMTGSWDAIAQVTRTDPGLATAVIRGACGLEPDPSGAAAAAWLADHRDRVVPVVVSVVDASVGRAGQEPVAPAVGTAVAPVVDASVAPVAPVGTAGEEPVALDLGVGSDLFDTIDWSQPAQVREAVQVAVAAVQPALGFAPQGQAWLPRSGRRAAGESELRSVRLGTLLFAPAGTPVRAPLDGVVVRVDADLGIVGLRHDVGEGPPVWSWLRRVDIGDLEPGGPVKAGDQLGRVRAARDDEDLPAHVHVHLAGRELPGDGVPPTFVAPSRKRAWTSICPDPAPLIGASAALEFRLPVQEVLEVRDHRFARSQRVYYDRPMNLVRGRGSWFYDEDGLAYLDVINNVTHVGHANPRVADAVARQMRKLNTNSRFLYEGIATYSQRLADTLPDPLEVVFLVCTGSEANDLALRIARQVTGRRDVLVIDGAYHGNTSAVTGISPNRFDGPGGSGAPADTHPVTQPNRYRGAFGYDHPDPGAAYAQELGQVVDRLVAQDRPPAAFFAESLMGTAGQVVLPAGYLRDSFVRVRAAGGLCVSDEVQVGFGRMGERFWGFELGDVVPDIVTMGKPIGNGFPLAAVVTTREIADAFDNGMRYFNTFGGNPVACAAGNAVLDIIEEEGLQQRARDAGALLRDALAELGSRHEVIGDVRGVGLYVGVELVEDRATRQPARALAHDVTERLKDEGVVVYPNGDLSNIIKLKPPMTTPDDDLLLFAEVLDQVLSEAR
ncbi:MAG TPA: aminotransferase class III-fold pyridoxal phosphate-dependent enzyme [Nitriliruptorales bacterium]